LLILAPFALFAGFVGVPPDFPVFGAIFSPEHNYFHHLLVYALPFMSNGGAEVFHVDAPAVAWQPVATSLFVAIAGLLVGFFMYGGRKGLAKGQEDPLIKVLGEPIYRTLQKRYYMDDLYNLILVRPSQAIARFVLAVIDKGIIDSILHGIAYVFTVTGDFIKVLNAWLIDGVGDGIPKGIFSLGGFMRRSQGGHVQVYLLIVLAAVLIIGIFLAWSAGAVLAS
jgi:NADH-quinone oxidoreductase subunit L